MWQSRNAKRPFYSIGAANLLLFILLCAYCVIDFSEAVYMIGSGNTIDINVSIWARIIPELAVVCVAFAWARPIEALRIKAPKPGNLFYSVMLAFFLYLPLTVMLDFLVEVIYASGASIPKQTINEAVTAMPFIIEFLYFCVLAPFAEEILFRGVIQNAYERKTGMWAFVISGFLFGLMHTDPLSSLNGIIVGLILGYIYMKTRSIWCPIAVHIFYNLFAFTALPDILVIRLPWVLGLFPESTMTFANTGYAVYAAGIAAIGVLMCYVFIRLMQKENPENKPQRAADYRPDPAQWAALTGACVLLAVRLMIVTSSYFI